MRPDRRTEPAGYGHMIRALNGVHYAGETAFYSAAPLRACESALMRRLRPGVRVLDVGCGAGRVATRLFGRSRPIGVDINLPALQVARAHRVELSVANASMAVLPLRDNTFDQVWCLRFSFNALPTAAERVATIRDLWRVCAPGGAVVVEAFNWYFAGRFGLVRAANLLDLTARQLRWHGQGRAGSLPLPSRDVLYLANKTETAAPGYAHLTTVRELRGLVDAAGLPGAVSITDEAGIVSGTCTPVRDRHRGYATWLVLDKPAGPVTTAGGPR